MYPVPQTLDKNPPPSGTICEPLREIAIIELQFLIALLQLQVTLLTLDPFRDKLFLSPTCPRQNDDINFTCSL